MSFLNCFSIKPQSREDRKYKHLDDSHKPYNGLAETDLRIADALESKTKPCSDKSGFDTARESDTYHGQYVVAEIHSPADKLNGFDEPQHDPSNHFVKDLPANPGYRKEISGIVKLGIDDEGLPQHLVAYINDHGHGLSSLYNLNKAIQDLRSSDLLTWASRYNLFVLWSADRQHPWDGLTDADAIAATLEIGKSEHDNRVVVLLNGIPVTSWAFSRGVFTTRDPVVWVTPTKKEVKVNLSLKFGTFYGYTQEDGEEVRAIDNASQHYIGTECHGVMWQADSELPHGWPVAPPIVAGKVNIASRTAALSPGATDPLSHFAGKYITHYLPNLQGKRSPVKGPELNIVNNNGIPHVYCNEKRIEAWAFNPNNVLSWEDNDGNTAWLLFMPLPEGTILMGNVLSPHERMNPQDRAHPHSFSIFGELKNQPSRLNPDEVMNPVIGKKVAIGLHMAATLLLGEILDTTYRIWDTNTPHYSPTEQSNSGNVSKAWLKHKLNMLEKIEELTTTFTSTFLTKEDGQLDINHTLVPHLAEAVDQSLRDALAQKQVATNSAQAAERDSRETEDCDTTKNVALATYKASQASIRSLEAAEAAAEAEKLTTEAANRALKAGTAAALNNAMATAQAFNEAREQALAASKAERRAATSALHQVEAGISFHAQQKNFDKLREVASASSIACKVQALAGTAVEGWESNTPASRQQALQAAKTAAHEAKECHKSTRRMQPMQQADNVYESPNGSTARSADGL